MQNGAVSFENNMEVPQKVQIGKIILTSHPTSGYLSIVNWNQGLKDIYHEHCHVLCSTIHNNQDTGKQLKG